MEPELDGPGPIPSHPLLDTELWDITGLTRWTDWILTSVGHSGTTQPKGHPFHTIKAQKVLIEPSLSSRTLDAE